MGGNEEDEGGRYAVMGEDIYTQNAGLRARGQNRIAGMVFCTEELGVVISCFGIPSQRGRILPLRAMETRADFQVSVMRVSM